MSIKQKYTLRNTIDTLLLSACAVLAVCAAIGAVLSGMGGVV